jgi:hypothetical protein
LAKALKYQMAFKTVDNKDVTVDFRVEGATGPVVELQAGVRPVVFREYNTEEDIFKPIRAFLCEIQIMTNVNGVTIDTFIANNDTDIQAIVHYNGYYGISTWYGYILQDDIEEVWDDGNHYLIVRAAEGFGLLKNIPFAVAGAEPVGKYTPLQFIENALSTLYPAGVTADYYVLNNLFHDSMLDTGGRHPLNQCYIDAKTFQQEGTEYDDCYTVIEKICAAFGQSIFFDGQMWLFRPEELYTSYNNNLRIANVTSVNQFEILTRYDIEIGVGREMQPIMPEMLRSLNRATKFDEVDFYYNQFDEVIQNENLGRGTLESSTLTTKTFTVDSWTFGNGDLNNTTPVPSPYIFRAIEEYETNLNGAFLDRYVYFTMPAVLPTRYWIKSQSVPIVLNGFIKIEFEHKLTNTTVGWAELMPVAWVILQVSGGYYALNQNGDWIFYTTIAGASGGAIRLDYSSGSGVSLTEWNIIEVESKPIPLSGTMTVYLGSGTTLGTTNTAYFRNLNITYNSAFERIFGLKKINGVNSYYEKSLTINNSFKQEIFLDDHYSSVHKGAIFQSDQTTLTDRDWYRYRFPTEVLGFRRQNATAHWEHNRFNRNKIDVNMYGISWDTGSGFELMNFKNTYRFMDDDVNKVYYPANISEIDLVNNTWSGTLVEVWDQTKDLPTTQTFEADFTLGTYTTATLTAPLTLISAGNFSIQTSNTARYDGVATIVTPVTVTISGKVSCSTYPKNVTFELRKSGTAIKTITFTVYTTIQPFNLDLSVGTQTIATNNTFTVVITGHSSVTIEGGDMKINTPGTAYTFDTYTDNYLYQ